MPIARKDERLINNFSRFLKYQIEIHKKPSFSIGFTIAEVLITLGIVGIVAAMTLPILNKNIQDIQFKAAWKKAYSQLEQASKLYLQKNDTFLGVSNYAAALQPYYKVVKYCDTQASTQGCWVAASQNYYLNKPSDPIAGIPNNNPAKDLGVSRGLFLADGTTMSTMAAWNSDCDADAYGKVCGWILIDVNGFNAPNTVGRDVYGVWVVTDRVIPIGLPMPVTWSQDGCKTTGWGCSSKYLME